MRNLLVLGTGAFALLSAFATRSYAGDAAAAQALFDDGKRLMDAHDYVAACAKFDESQRQDPGMGTLFHLADCDEHLGKTASAWAAYLEVAADAKAHGEGARAAAADARAAALEDKLARLTIDPGAEKTTPGLQLLRDGAPIGPGQWSTSVPVNPGPHVIEARAPGKGAWTTTVDVLAASRSLVTVPLLADAPPGALASASGTTSESVTTTSAELPTGPRGGAQRATGLVVGALGLAGVGVGAYFGVVSLGKHSDAEPHCSGNVCDPAGVTYRNDARTAGNASTVAFAIGGAALLGGIITFATAPHGSDFHTAVSVGPGNLAFSGSF